MNDTRIWSAAQMRALFPHKKTKRVHHLQAEDALKRLCQVHNRMRFRCALHNYWLQISETNWNDPEKNKNIHFHNNFEYKILEYSHRFYIFVADY